MAYQPRENPYLDQEGYPLPGKILDARAFAEAENGRYLDSLPPEQHTQVEARQRNFQAHQNS